MVDFCRENGIQLLCYGSVAGGFLSARYAGLPEPEEPLPNRSLTKYKLIIDELGFAVDTIWPAESPRVAQLPWGEPEILAGVVADRRPAELQEAA